MIYYANPCGEHICDLMSAGRLGCITTPEQGNLVFPDDGWDVIADNGCFGLGDRWDDRKWFAWLLNQPRSIRFAVCPDVFDPTGRPCHQETLDRWRQFAPTIERHGFTPAFVCQVGCTPDVVPDDAPVLFLGGTDEWKLGPIASEITARYRSERWVHMGRVNSKKRFRSARAMGCHSADGTYLTYGPKKNLPKTLTWLIDQLEQPMIFEQEAS